jgi:hypothetical protein
MSWFGQKQRDKYHSMRRAQRKQALLFWGAVLLVALLIVVVIYIQSLGHGPAMNNSWDPLRDWHQRLD